MQDARCKMQNDHISFGDRFLIIPEGDTSIVHSASCILHLSKSQTIVYGFTETLMNVTERSFLWG
jgi:hypothetical protein